jgi:hypothetical protein
MYQNSDRAVLLDQRGVRGNWLHTAAVEHAARFAA